MYEPIVGLEHVGTALLVHHAHHMESGILGHLGMFQGIKAALPQYEGLLMIHSGGLYLWELFHLIGGVIGKLTRFTAVSGQSPDMRN